MHSRVLAAIEVTAFTVLVVLASFWAWTQNSKLEPWTVICGLVGAGVELFRRFGTKRSSVGQGPHSANPTDIDLEALLRGKAWLPVEPFAYRWPDASESYEEAYQTQVDLGGRCIPITIGFCNRAAAGDDNRRRSVVFMGRPPGLNPLVEFSGENSHAFAMTGRMASVIKLPSGKHLRPGDSIPPEYAGLPLVTYNQLVVGPYAAGSLGIVAHKENLSLMARHGLIRAHWRKII